MIRLLIEREVQLFLEQNNQYDIYVDMDGVLTNFDKQLEDKTGIKNGREFELEHGQDVFWDKIHEHGVEFWSEMEWMPMGKKLWNYVKRYNPTILSAPSKHKDSKVGKIKWIKEHLGDVSYILIKATDKQKYANENAILIDDYHKNISQWKDKNGIAIHHIDVDNTLNHLKKLGI